MPKAPKVRDSARQRSRASLGEDLKKLENPGRLKEIRQRRENMENLEETPLNKAFSKKILRQIQLQQQEMRDSEDEKDAEERIDVGALRPNSKNRVSSVVDEAEDSSELEDAGSDLEELELDEEDERSLALFMPRSNAAKRSLADMIMDKISEANRVLAGPSAAAAPLEEEKSEKPLEPRIVQVYTEVGAYLSHYSSGKIPKAFKIIPSLRNWEEILILTNPAEWTAQAVSAATRLFASNLNQRMAQRFYNIVLYPRVRDDIQSHKKLNYHLYQSCKKAIYKPAAFFRGILLPLAEEGCSVREAVILASILAKCSIPVLDSAVALMKLAELNQREYSGPVTLFMKTLLNKKYSLPYRVLDGVLDFFLSFERDPRSMPLIWHQALLVFIQRYKNSLKPEERDKIRSLIKKQNHPGIAADIKRELTAAEQYNAAVGAGELQQGLRDAAEKKKIIKNDEMFY